MSKMTSFSVFFNTERFQILFKTFKSMHYIRFIIFTTKNIHEIIMKKSFVPSLPKTNEQIGQFLQYYLKNYLSVLIHTIQVLSESHFICPFAGAYLFRHYCFDFRTVLYITVSIYIVRVPRVSVLNCVQNWSN